MAAPRKRNAVTWVAAPEPTLRSRPAKGALRCSSCQSGACEKCTRVGCFHQCPNLREGMHGVSALGNGAEHGAPGPGRRG